MPAFSVYIKSRGWCHVWTAPWMQGLNWFDVDRCGKRSCVRPVCAVQMTAGPDEVRLPGPVQSNELECPDSTSGFPGFAAPFDHHHSCLPLQRRVAAR